MDNNFNLISTNLLNNNINNFQEDSNIRKLQQNLILMGFDITMINKIILYFKIRNVDEALDYLIKSEDGMWNHPFIPKEVINDEKNKILGQPKIMMNSVISKISNSVNIKGSRNESEQNEKIDYKIENDICEICGELKDFHKIKEYNINNFNFSLNISNNNENNSFFNNVENNKININDNNNNHNKKILIDDEEDEKEEDIAPNKCEICMDDFENPVEIEKCKHKFCYDCFNSYLVNLINNNNIDKIPCPNNKCNNKELTEEFFSQYLSEQEFFKYRQFKSQNEIARDAKKMFCPHCNSYAQIEGNIEEYDSNSPNYKKKTLQCMNGHNFCSCGRPLHENECYHDEKEFKDLVKNEQIKKCPKCGFLIKKMRGCNHMTCGSPICKYEFCWLCMNEAVPGHYEFGPCAGRQFFDPDSFSYYLEQNFPILSYIYNIIKFVFSVFSFIICFIAVPALGLSLFSFGLLYIEEVDIGIRSKIVRFFLFLICLCMSTCCQSLVYMAWGVTIFLGEIVMFFSIVYFFVTIISFICKACCSCFGFNDNSLSQNENENENIELSESHSNNEF